MRKKSKKVKEGRTRIRDWKGLLHNRSRRIKLLVFFGMFVLAASMTFTQFGFVGVGTDGEYAGYVLGLLCPITVTALLLGKGAGMAQGLLSGAVLYEHAQIQPLDLFERYLVSTLNSFGLYATVGLLIGLFFAIALHNDPQGKRRKVYLFVSCFFTSIVTSILFLINSVIQLVMIMVPVVEEGSQTTVLPSEIISAFSVLEGIDVQLFLDALLMLATALVVDHIVKSLAAEGDTLSVRTAFRTKLFAAVALVFCVVQALSFAHITRDAERTANEHMSTELDHIGTQLSNRYAEDVGLLEGELGDKLSPEVAQTLRDLAMKNVLEGYDLSDGTIVVFSQGSVAYSNSPAYPVGKAVDELLVSSGAQALDTLVARDTPSVVVYDTKPYEDKLEVQTASTAQLGYARAIEAGDYQIMMIEPASMVFANRWVTVTAASLLAFVLLATVYVVASHLLVKNVVEPIDRTNESLAKITGGDLSEVVREAKTSEFVSLSAGINATVDSLKDAIAKEAARLNNDLATARAIQESALPRVFPPFPEIGAFDIFAAMDAAKEVGGDFFDYFLIDDRTLGFLIADVSGKGIPGALFMMAAKTEIKNYLSTGMEPAQAIESANRRLCANNDAGMFVTVWAATLDWETGLLTYVNAGHNFPLLRHGSGGEWEWLKKKCGLFLGTFETAKYRQETLELHAGDELLLYTDGVNEAFSPNEEEYGNDRLDAFLAEHATIHPRELVRALRADVARWADGAEQSDDVTILALEFGVAPEVTGTITVPATPDHLPEADALIAGELERRLCPINVQHQVEVAMEELFVNVCRYAYADREEPGTVQVSYAYGTNPSSITVELRDTGIPFDPVTMDDPTRPGSIQEAKIGGLGILMVKRTMDDLIYIRDDDANVVVFKKGW